MTSPEHTLVGIHASLACGVHRTFGWPAVVMAGLASNVPDWDGLPMLIDMQRFEEGHRVWGHNLIAIIVSSLFLAWTQVKYGWIERLSRRVVRRLPVEGQLELPTRSISAKTLVCVAVLAQVIHLACDMVVSGGQELTDWKVQPFWPISDIGYVYPLIPWGDVGPTVVLMTGAVLIAMKSSETIKISVGTLFVLCLYLIGRGWARGTL